MAGLTRIKSDGIGDNCDLDGSGTLVLDSTNNRVGIGTSAPESLLHIQGPTGAADQARLTISERRNTGTTNWGIDFLRTYDSGGDNQAAGFVRCIRDGGASNAGMVFGIGNKTDTSREKMRINSSGNVGIGTTAPTSLLHLAANAPYITFEDKDNNQDWQLQATAWFALRDQTAGEERLRIDSSGRIGIGSGSQDLSAFNANGSQDLVIYSKGTSGLNAHAGITLLGQSTTASQCSISFADGASGAQRYAGAIDYFHSNDSMSFRTSGNAVMRIDSSGNLLIGTTAPKSQNAKVTVETSGACPLEIHSTSASGGYMTFTGDGSSATVRAFIGSTAQLISGGSELDFTVRAQGELSFATNGANERMRIDSDGDVLIGNTTNYTNSKLAVRGEIGVSNGAFACVESGKGANGTFTSCVIDFSISTSPSTTMFETQAFGYNNKYIDSLLGTYGGFSAVSMRNSASTGNTIALSFPNTGGVTHRLTISGNFTHPVVKVKATCGGLASQIELLSITWS